MDSPPARQAPRFDSSVILAILVALPMAAIVVAVLVSALTQNDERKPQIAAGPPPTKEPDKPPAEVPLEPPSAVVKRSEEEAAKAIESTDPQKTRQPAAQEIPATEPPSPPLPASPAGQTASTKPWQAVLDSAAEPPSYTKLAFLPFDEAFANPGRDDLTPWFQRTSAAGFRINKIPTQYGRSGTIEGTGKLLSPWPDDGVLRLQLDNFNRLKLHFFCGLEGVTLVYYEDQGNRWAAYATTRDEGKPTPKTWAITATDDDRCRRTEMRSGGPIELRCLGGELLLSRGDVVLLAAPLAGPPSDVFFEGRATIHGIALARTADAPTSPLAKRINTDIRRPADRKWIATKPETARPQSVGDGSLRLAGDKLQERAACYSALPASDLHELLLELSDVAPGAGVYLGRGEGQPAEVVCFQRDRKTGALAVALRPADDTWEADFDAPADKPAPLVQPHCWLRLLYGCGNVRWWLSSDGVHWAQTEPAQTEPAQGNAAPGITSIGLQIAANCPNSGLTLKRITVSRLDGISSLAKDELVAAAPALATAAPADWLPEAMKQKPAEVETGEWLRACSVRTLASGAPRGLAYPLLEALLDDAAARGLSTESQLAALDDAMLMALDLRDGQAMRVGILTRYAQLGLRAADTEGSPAWSSVRGHYHAAPALTSLQLPTDLDRVIRWQLVAAANQHQPQATLDLIDRLRFFQQHRDRPLVDWAEGIAHRELPARGLGDLGVRKDSWRGPLIEDLSKEAYNLLTELKAVLQSEAWEDAARLVTSLDPEAAPGVAPYVSDRALLTSIPVAVQLSLEDYPQLRQSLGDKFEALAKLRIAQAINAGDAATIGLATVQFAGTQAAAEAQRWLGDQALVAGQFERAVSLYQRASAAAPPTAAETAPRIRLAAAMLGRDMGAPVTRSVQFGDVIMSPNEFEALIAEMRGRGSSAGPESAEAATAVVPPPARFEAQVRSRLDGPVGERPQEEVGRRTNQLRVSWPDRQIAAAVEASTMYVANHFQVAAYNLTSGQRLWQSQTPPGSMQRSQEWGLIPMRPLVAGDRIFVRLLYSPGPLLACLDKATGKLIWTAESRDREFLVSDPLLVQGQLVALGIAVQPDLVGQLRFYVFDAQSGETLRQHDLVRLRNSWGGRSCCEVAEVEDGLVAALGGVTIGVDAKGTLRWVRTHTMLPADEDPRWLLQMFQRPMVKGEHVFVAQPGVRTVDCLAAATGRLVWSAVLPEVVGVVGLAGDMLIVRTQSDVRALDANDGSVRWRHAADDLFSFQLVDDRRLLAAGRVRVPGESDRWQVRLTWIDPRSGTPLATTALTDLADSDPRLGPLVPCKNRLFTFFGRGQHDPTRDVVELVPHGEADAPPPQPDAWHERLR